MATSIKSKYSLIDKKRISKQAQDILSDIAEATNNFKDVSPKLRKEFTTFYDKLKSAKPEAIRGTKEYKAFGKEGSPKPSATPEPSKALKDAIAKSRSLRKAQGLGTSESDIIRDAGRPALKSGRRKSKEGNTYYEYRENRIDRKPKNYPKLAEGGMMKDGGRVIDDVEMYVMIHGYYPESVMAMRGDGMALGIARGDVRKFELSGEDAKIADKMGYEFDYYEEGWVKKDEDEYAEGGGVHKSEEEVWNNWSVEQRKHFLKDHRIFTNKEQDHRASLYRFDELPIDLVNSIKSTLKEHISEVQYAKGGNISNRSNYLSQREIDHIETKSGKVIKGSQVIDGAYVRKKVKFADGGGMENLDMFEQHTTEVHRTEEPPMVRTQFEEEEFEYGDGGVVYGDGGFYVKDMREHLNKMFPDSFGFTVNTPSPQSRADFDLKPNQNESYGGLTDADITSKLHFPKYKRDHEINFRIYQGGENTYFYFYLNDENGNPYIGQFGFKDDGDVPSTYITRFIAFLMEQYQLPFKVSHDVYAKGGGVGLKVGDEVTFQQKYFSSYLTHRGKIQSISNGVASVKYVNPDSPELKLVTDIPITNLQKYAKGGSLLGGSHYNTGRSWHLDRERFNKNEDWEKPMRNRKSSK